MEAGRRRGLTAAGLMAAALLLALAGDAAGPRGGAAAVTANGQPAFTTSQAPGGASTAGKKVIALTFDDGPGPFTPAVLSALEQSRVPATFFEIGDEVARNPQIARMVVAAGYPVEDHTWSHPDLTAIPVPAVASQIDMTQAEIRAVTGTTPECVRPPYDAWNGAVLNQVAVPGSDDHELLGRPQGLDAPRRPDDRRPGRRRRVPRCGGRHARCRRRPLPDRGRAAADHLPAQGHGVLVRPHLRASARFRTPGDARPMRSATPLLRVPR